MLAYFVSDGEFDTPLYQKIKRDEVNAQEALTLNVKV